MVDILLKKLSEQIEEEIIERLYAPPNNQAVGIMEKCGVTFGSQNFRRIFEDKPEIDEQKKVECRVLPITVAFTFTTEELEQHQNAANDLLKKKQEELDKALKRENAEQARIWNERFWGLCHPTKHI